MVRTCCPQPRQVVVADYKFVVLQAGGTEVTTSQGPQHIRIASTLTMVLDTCGVQMLRCRLSPPSLPGRICEIFRPLHQFMVLLKTHFHIHS